MPVGVRESQQGLLAVELSDHTDYNQHPEPDRISQPPPVHDVPLDAIPAPQLDAPKPTGGVVPFQYDPFPDNYSQGYFAGILIVLVILHILANVAYLGFTYGLFQDLLGFENLPFYCLHILLWISLMVILMVWMPRIMKSKYTFPYDSWISFVAMGFFLIGSSIVHISHVMLAITSSMISFYTILVLFYFGINGTSMMCCCFPLISVFFMGARKYDLKDQATNPDRIYGAETMGRKLLLLIPVFVLITSFLGFVGLYGFGIWFWGFQLESYNHPVEIDHYLAPQLNKMSSYCNGAASRTTYAYNSCLLVSNTTSTYANFTVITPNTVNATYFTDSNCTVFEKFDILENGQCGFWSPATDRIKGSFDANGVTIDTYYRDFEVFEEPQCLMGVGRFYRTVASYPYRPNGCFRLPGTSVRARFQVDMRSLISNFLNETYFSDDACTQQIMTKSTSCRRLWLNPSACNVCYFGNTTQSTNGTTLLRVRWPSIWELSFFPEN